MKIAVMTFRLRAEWVYSLKEKRMIVKSLIARQQNKYRGAACRWQAFSTDRAGRRDLIPKSQLYVHLSSDKETAKKVGSRHGKCRARTASASSSRTAHGSGTVIYKIDCRQMAADGYHFFESANHVWLTKEVPARYLKKL